MDGTELTLAAMEMMEWLDDEDTDIAGACVVVRTDTGDTRFMSSLSDAETEVMLRIAHQVAQEKNDPDPDYH